MFNNNQIAGFVLSAITNSMEADPAFKHLIEQIRCPIHKNSL